MRLQDALYNWLQIKIVADARPDDHAAKETASFFADILKEDHGLELFEVGIADDSTYEVRCVKNGQSESFQFDREATEQLLADIMANPKYNE